MALSLAQAAPLKPEIKLAQALSEFEAVLPDDQKTKLRTYRGQSPPNSTDVIRFTAEIDRDAGRNRRSRQCVGPRLTNVLNAVQKFSTVVDSIVGSSQSQIAGAIWGTLKISLQLACAISSYFDQLSTLFMRIGLTCPSYQDFGLLYPESTRLQRALCGYFAVIVRLCKQAVVFLKKPFWSQLSSSIFNPFEQEFGGFQQNLENLAGAIRGEISLASNQAQQNETKEMSRFRAFSRKISDNATWDIENKIRKKKLKTVLRFLDVCSVYNHEKSWKQARKQGNTDWICHDKEYKQWKQETKSSMLWCTGILGSGKTVLSANVVEDLKITTPEAVAYFFCKHDEAESLETRTIIGSIARQIFDQVQSDIVDVIPEIRPGIIDIDQVLDYLQELLPSKLHKYFIIIDGLDECEKKETKLLLQCLKQLLMSKHCFRIYCSSRPDVFRWGHTINEPQWNVSMSQTSSAIEEYVEGTLVELLESGILVLGDSKIILTIQDALLENAHGMFLWVVFQIESICSQKTDEAILTALKDLPKDLPDTFNRILRKLQQANAADPQFCQRIFDLVAAAQRPLTLEELREAVSVEPGETAWDASKLVNDMLKTLLDSCGSLVTVDEEHRTVHFAHHSVKQHLLSEPIDSDMSKYHIKMIEADLYMGEIIVTYLNFEIFDRQLAEIKSTMRPQVKIEPSAIVGGSLPPSIIAKLAVRLLKKKRTPGLDIYNQLAAGTVDGSEAQIQPTEPAHSFLSYAQKHWLFHTKVFKHARAAVYPLWEHLIDGEIEMIELPWPSTKTNDFGGEYMGWMIQNEHWALINRSLVHFAKSTDPEAAKPLLELLEEKAKISINVRNIDLEAMLYLASLWKNRSVVLLSLRNKAYVNAVTGYLGTALHAASYRGHEEIARLLLENGADANAEGRKHGTALGVASVLGHEAIVRLLLDNGADVNAGGAKYGTALQAASVRGHKEIARLLLDNGADVNAGGGKYGTTLQAASVLGHEAIVRLLLDNGADVNAEGRNYDTALGATSENGHKEIARLLLENGAGVNARHREYGTALQAASAFGHEETVRLLLENGADVNARGGEHGTALQIALVFGHEEIARLLLENGADVNAGGGKYRTALQAASVRGHKEIARLLLENGADVNAEGRKHGAALRAASVRGHIEIARLLLENGADVNAGGGKYGTALQAASVRGHKEIARLLLENGADVDAAAGYYGTALRAASVHGHEAIVRLLLDNGANVNAKGGQHETALQEASKHRHEAIVKLLLDHGAFVDS